MTAVALRSACLHAFGISGAAATKSMISKSAATRRGAAMLLASGMKISAEPKPEKPRAVPDTKAIAQIAIAALVLTPAGMQARQVHPRKTPPVFLVTSATIFGADRVDFLVGHGLFARLDRHGDGDRISWPSSMPLPS